MNDNIIKIKRALISVFDKTDIVKLAKSLAEHGIEIVSTGGTARLLVGNNIEVTQIDEITKFPEVLGGRVKTLHPNIYAGLLSRLNNSDDKETKAKIRKADSTISALESAIHIIKQS